MILEEQALIESARQGDSEAFGQLVQTYQDRLCTAMTHLVGCYTEAEDVVQEAFVSAFFQLKSFRGDAAFYSWLYRIAHNKAISRRRKKRATISLDAELQHNRIEPVDGSGSPSQPIECREQNQRVQQALNRLSENFRAILILREWEQFDYATIANILKVNVGTVRSRLHRARLQLREEMCKLGDATAGQA